MPYYWIGGPPPSGIALPGTDFDAIVNRRISVTPVHLDLTGRRLLRELPSWDWALDLMPKPSPEEVEALKPTPVERERFAEETKLERR